MKNTPMLDHQALNTAFAGYFPLNKILKSLGHRSHKLGHTGYKSKSSRLWQQDTSRGMSDQSQREAEGRAFL